MKRLLLSLVAFAFLWCSAAISPAQATGCGGGSGTCFAIATGNWNAGATWSDSSGGASCSATCTTGPAAGDAVTLDSGTNGKSVTINVSASIATLVSTCTTCTLIHNAVTLTISGNTFTLSSGMTYTAAASSRILLFTSTSGTCLITTAGKTIAALTTNGSGGTFQLQDDLTNRSDSPLTVTLGTLDFNGHNVSTGGITVANSASAGLTMGTGTTTITGTLTGFVISGTSAVVSAASATLVFADFDFNVSASLSNKTYGTITINPNTGANVSVVSLLTTGSLTIGTLNATGPRRILFSNAQTTTINNAFNLTGPLFLTSTATNGTQATIAAGAASTIGGSGATGAMVQNLHFTTSPVTVTGYDLSNNTFSAGGGITAPSGGGGGNHII